MKEENKELALLINGKSTKELVSIDVHTKINQSIDNYLSEPRFNYLVTVDNLKDVKSNNTELNASIKIIKDFGKKLVELESDDINIFKSNIITYWSKIDLKREKRKEDIKVFEDETRIILKDLTIEYINEQYLSLDIKEYFRKVSYKDLVIISNINSSRTESGDIKASLKKGVKDSLNIRLQQCKSTQDKYDMRLILLENICYKNGLETPLTVNHVQGIIFEEDETIYQEKLARLIKDEIERVETIKSKLQKKADDEAALKVNQQMKEIDNIFLQPWGMMELETLQSKIKEITDYNLEPFRLCFDHAKASKIRAVTFINQSIWGKEKALEDTKKVIEDMATPFEDIPNTEIVIMQESEPKEIQIKFDFSKPEISDDEETIFIDEPFVPYEKEDEDEKIIVAKFKINGTSGLSNDEILSSIKEILFNAGVDDESLISLEVL